MKKSEPLDLVKRLDRDEFVEALSEMVEEDFPKGKCKERGHALVLVGRITTYLMDKGLIK